MGNMNKENLRKQILSVRAQLTEKERSEKSARITRQILALSEYCKSENIMLYLNFRDEVETTELARITLEYGKKLIVPYCPGKNIIPCLIDSVDNDVEPGRMGIREPRKDKIRKVAPREIDLVLVPGVAFDFSGNRLGYGKGYYDRFLPLLREDALVIGLAFACQLVEKIAVEEHDYKMSLLITENGVIYPR